MPFPTSTLEKILLGAMQVQRHAKTSLISAGPMQFLMHLSAGHSTSERSMSSCSELGI